MKPQNTQNMQKRIPDSARSAFSACSAVLQHFDQISEAPDAVSRLRRFILDLAVRGKLVEQDPNDEPASELLKRIEAEKKRLVKAGEIRKEKPLPAKTENEIAFQIPPNWAWSRLAEVGFINPRNTADDGAQVSFVPMPLIPADYGIPSRHDVRTWGEIKSGYTHFAEGDIALAKITPCFENGKSTVFRGLTGGIGAGTTELHVLRPVVINPDYVLLFLRCPHFIESGISRMTGTAGQKRVPTDYFAYTPVPLPPLAEQHRIVAKVDELMALCDELEAAQAKRERGRDRLVAATLSRLTAENAEQAEKDPFPDPSAPSAYSAVPFFLTHLPRFTTRPEHIHQLRQTILNLAVHGELVPQDPKEEPASVLLKRIEREKQRLIHDGKLKKDKRLWEGVSQTPPFWIPSGWIWTRLQDVFEISRGGSPRPAGDRRYFGGEIPWITVGEITKDAGRFLTKTESGLTADGSERSRFIHPGDLLLTNSGATLGVPKISEIRGCINDGVAVLRLFHPYNLNDFAYEFLRSQTEAFRNLNQGMGQPNLNTPIIAAWHFPLPPLAEQRRIVATVNELMALCDDLEARLTTASTTRRQLLEATLYEALAVNA